jgi:hypothetical protein
MADRLVVHTRDQVIEIPLTGDPRLDAALERFAARGGAVLREGGALGALAAPSAVSNQCELL